MRIVFTDEAEASLEKIGDYIAEDNPRRAITFVRELRDSANNLSEFPRAFPFVPRYKHYGIRRRPYGDYLIFYSIEPDHVAIHSILHGAQDYEAILFLNF